MNRRLVLGFTSIAFASLVLIACVAAAPGGSVPVGSAPVGYAPGSLFQSPVTTPPSGSGNVHLDFAFDTPPILNQPVTGTLILLADQDQSAARIVVMVHGPRATSYDQEVGPLAANQPKQVPIGFLFPEEGRYRIVYLVEYAQGLRTASSINIEIGREGVVVNPTQIPGPVPLRNSKATSSPAPTPESTISPTQTPAAEVPVGTRNSEVVSHDKSAALITPTCEATKRVTLAGWVKYDDRADAGTPNPIAPARYIRIDAWDKNSDGPAGQSPDTFIGTTFTKADGSWQIPNVCNVDGDGLGSRIDLYELIYADTAGSKLPDGTQGPVNTVMLPSSGVTYTWETKTWGTVPNISSPVSDTNRFVLASYNIEALWLLGDANRAWSYIHNNPWVAHNDPGPVYTFWQSGWNNWGVCNGSCFIATVYSPNWFGTFVANASVDAPDVPVHEIGHAYRQNVAGLFLPSCPLIGGHGIFQDINPQCAWQEGWADFLPMQVNGGHCFDFTTVRDCGASYDDLEAGQWGDGHPVGDGVEGRVAGALLDLHDQTNEGLDTADGYGFHRTWNIIDNRFDSASENTLADFYAHWNNHGYGADGPLLVPFYQNTIDYGIGLANLPSVLKTYGGGGTATKAPGTWVSSINLRNPGATQAKGGVLFFDAAGHVAASLLLGSDLPAGGSHSYFVPSIGGLANGAYAAVVASDPSPLQVVTNLTSSGPATAGA